MEKAELRALFENEYPGKEKIVEQLIKPIFAKAKDTTLTDELELSEADKKQIKSFRIIAQVRGGFPITFADVEVNDSVALKRSRVNIQSCVRKVLENDSNAIIFFHFSDNAKEWRVSYCHRATSNKESTDAKRYTYLCGTEHACRTIAERFDTLKGLTTIKDEDMLNAFGVEPLSKEFFDQYREHYADLVEYISGKRFVKKGGKFVEEKTKNANGAFKNVFDGDDKLVRDYVKKTMGRLVFLHFLQKKGWLGVSKEAAWGCGDKNFIYNLFKNAGEEVKKDFLEQALEPLFFKTLNTDRGKEALAPKTVCGIYGREIRIPYLNGGLFEEDELDKKKVKFRKEHFETLLEFFNQYNFTIDETDPDDQEIGVDPEMLGKIFENLLEDNKDKGAFYTPKEIVQYMCRESLIAYLNEKTKLDARDFVINHEIAFTDAQKADLLKALLDVKVCDPAVGSGAFPMGMLNELLACTQLLTGNSKTRSELKKHIVKSNIYGVDIEKGAVDIARLRFWLAIIVDEEEPIPLPNLDYKIMQGNSLLESYEGIDLSCLTKKHEYEHNQQDLFGGEDSTIKSLTKAIDGFYIPSDHIAKAKIRNQISENVIQLLKERQIPPKVINDLKKLDLHENNQFFLWHTWFNDVFNRPNKCNGFDIVIGNPPYIQLQDNKGYLANIYDDKNYKVFDRSGDIYSLFYEQGINLITQCGIMCYITSSQWLRAGYGKNLRKYLIENSNPKLLIDFTGVKIFDATVDPCILLLTKESYNKRTFATMAKPYGKEILPYLDKFVRENASYCSFINQESWIILSAEEQKLKNKLKSYDASLNSLGYTIYRGVLTGFNDAFIISAEKRNQIINECKSKEERKRTEKLITPVLRGRDIRKFGYISNGLYQINTHNGVKEKGIQRIKIEDYPSVKKHLDSYFEKLSKRSDKGDTPYNLRNCAYLEDFYSPKIVYPETTVRRSEFFYDEEKFLLDKTCFFIIGKNLKFIEGILTSKLIEWYLEHECRLLGKTTIQYSKQWMENIPIPTATPAQQQEIITLVDKILAAKKASAGSATNHSDSKADTTALEHKIDELVYKLYGLTEEEIAIVEK